MNERRRSNLGHRTRRAEAIQRLWANQTQEIQASTSEGSRRRMVQICAEEPSEQRAARLEDVRLQARRSRSVASDLLRSQQNERDKMRMAERRQQEVAASNKELCLTIT
ncbi:unnamed protein product [Nezara viridula]|uniref:Uncharacterized protein n=1 Tax=Nezara viridula TaxID=85310 RepID=A0A9P0ECP4_NEZVI|nr:unnamed protein product [Nezara viridula]